MGSCLRVLDGVAGIGRRCRRPVIFGATESSSAVRCVVQELSEGAGGGMVGLWRCSSSGSV
jgi:hypothetical protein